MSSAGTFISILDTNVYVAGLVHATKALFIIYDIFGCTSQILKYADFKPVLRVENRFERMVHGWLSARGDLEKEEVTL
ncbi:hypothetical protein B0A55_05558 [Friedmanniomyces simplex]|uniref:Uncharacterized protein n=1 Tax=Friedmanniomyces simplex TaxID=329884 RepID=A0A4U0XGJ2_9PEZI|nr:hypothetical protein B0A55_05558 [Friedmanniomyces simplex]